MAKKKVARAGQKKSKVASQPGGERTAKGKTKKKPGARESKRKQSRYADEIREAEARLDELVRSQPPDGESSRPGDRPLLPRPTVNPFTGEPISLPQARDFGDVARLVAAGNAGELKKLFDEGMTFEEFQINYEIDASDHDYLHVAAERGALETVKLLVEQGADTAELDSQYHVTALETAVTYKQRKVAEYLVTCTESTKALKAATKFLRASRAKHR